MTTTTPDDGASADAQPQEPAAVTTGHNVDQVITTDEQGTPTLTPVASEAQEEKKEETPETPSAEEAATEDKTEEAQADDEDDLSKFAKAKGFDPAALTDGERKALDMARNAEKKMHESRQVQSPVQPPEELPLTDGEDPRYDIIAERQNRQEQLLYVRNWFDVNPEAKDHRTELQQIATQRPWLTNMDDVYAHFKSNPSREADIKRQGGKDALTNLAQKQSQVPPASGATNSGVYQTTQITPENVYDQVDNHDQAWFEKNHKAISDAMAGKTQ